MSMSPVHSEFEKNPLLTWCGDGRFLGSIELDVGGIHGCRGKHYLVSTILCTDWRDLLCC